MLDRDHMKYSIPNKISFSKFFRNQDPPTHLMGLVGSSVLRTPKIAPFFGTHPLPENQTDID